MHSRKNMGHLLRSSPLPLYALWTQVLRELLFWWAIWKVGDDSLIQDVTIVNLADAIQSGTQAKSHSQHIMKQIWLDLGEAEKELSRLPAIIGDNDTLKSCELQCLIQSLEDRTITAMGLNSFESDHESLIQKEQVVGQLFRVPTYQDDCVFD